MLRSMTIVPAILLSSVLTAAVRADDARVTITVEKKPEAAEGKPPFSGHRPSVDVAILLDTSNSMDGLISQAKTQLWTIVQQFANAKKNGQTPQLRVALFEYGNTNLPASEGYIRQVVPLTDDLDKLSEALFQLKTSGGDEYCGQVIQEAIKRLDWSKEPNGYKAIFIAGNEPFTQGPVDYHAACKEAIERSIVVNTIHCGNREAGLRGQWQDGAKLAEGESFNIDQDRAIVHVKCPQDEIIIKLNAELNKTYLWFGSDRARAGYAENQAAQDENARSLGLPLLAQRGSVKGTSVYCFRESDLCDALNADDKVLTKIKDEQLPESLRKLSVEERRAYVTKVAAQRAEIQQKISAVSAERDAYLAKEQSKLASNAPAEATLGTALVTTIQKQLKDRGFDAAGK
jgi:hypothetical protein